MKRNTSRSGGRHPNRAMFGIAALALLAVVAFSYRQWEQFQRANAEAAQTREVVDSIEQLLSSVTDAETGQRGFLLTGEDRYLQPYNRAIQVIPNQLDTVKRLLAGRAGESSNLARLESLVAEKLAELGQTLDLRRTQGLSPAMTVVLSDRGQRTMDQIRALVAQIRRTELSSQAQASTEGEAAAQMALVAVVAGSLVLLFLFAAGLEPFIGTDLQAKGRSWILRYGAAVLAAAAAVVLRMALIPLIGPTELAFSISIVAVLFSAWFGGFRAGALCILLSALASDWYFTEPVGSFLVRKPADQISLVIFIVIGFGVALLSDAQGRALVRARRAENAERDERQRFETTLASIGDAVMATDAEGRIVFLNKVALSLLRAPETGIVGKHLDDVFRIVNEFSRARVESPVTKVLREGSVVGLANHTILIARDGTEIPIDDSGASIRSAEGPISGTVLVFRDITERRRAERTAQLLSAIVESSDDAIISKDMNGVVTSWNKGAARLFGYSAEEMIGHQISVLIPPDRVDETSAMLESVAKGEKVEQYETVRRTRRGALINVSITWSPLRDVPGRIVGASKIVRDITARKQAEERFHLAVEAAPNGMLIADQAGKIILVNSQIEKLFGYSREDLIGQPVEILVPHQLQEIHSGFRQAFYADAKSRLMGAGRDLYGRRKDGSEFPVEVGLNPIDTHDGRWVLGAILDISERKRIEEQHIELAVKEHTIASEKALRAKDAELARIARALAVGELAASIAHEVNQPLAGVITNAEAGLRWLGGAVPNVPEAKESLSLIVRDGGRASGVIERIREFLKKERPDTEPLDMNETIQEAVALARAELLRRKIDVRLDLFGALPPVTGDRIQLQQVILNLILNGSEAMVSTEGSRELLVTSQKFDSDRVLIAVRDSGVGIAPQDLDRMFDAFFTTKPKGMGMGLSISRSIIEAHHGRIWAEPNDGAGVTVQFSLPAESVGQLSSAAGDPS